MATGGGWLHLDVGLRETALVLGILIVYLDTHQAGHYLVGRPLGIGFRGFGLRGTDHPEVYPPGLRQVVSVLPMCVALTEPTSRRAARRFALAAMYGAGKTATTVCTRRRRRRRRGRPRTSGARHLVGGCRLQRGIERGRRCHPRRGLREGSPRPARMKRTRRPARRPRRFHSTAEEWSPLIRTRRRSALDRLIRALHTHALCSPMHQRLRRETRREPAAQRPHAPRHPAMACRTQDWVVRRTTDIDGMGQGVNRWVW